MKRDTLIKIYKNILNDILININKEKKEYRGRKNKFDNYFYLNYILRVLFYGEYWNTINCIFCDISTIRKKFYKWDNMGLFKIAYDILFKKYSKNRTFKHLFIDSTIVQNMNCSNGELVKHYFKIVSKKQIKISVICDSNKIPILHKITSPHTHDIKICKNIIKDISVNIKKKSILVGDKGYISKRRVYKANKNKIKIVSEYRKNQKKENTVEEIKLLKKRTIIENLFATIKNSYKRTRFIYDRNINHYNTFLLMAFSCQIIKFLNKGLL
jgi:hypothetical protein